MDGIETEKLQVASPYLNPVGVLHVRKGIYGGGSAGQAKSHLESRNANSAGNLYPIHVYDQ